MDLDRRGGKPEREGTPSREGTSIGIARSKKNNISKEIVLQVRAHIRIACTPGVGARSGPHDWTGSGEAEQAGEQGLQSGRGCPNRLAKLFDGDRSKVVRSAGWSRDQLLDRARDPSRQSGATWGRDP